MYVDAIELHFLLPYGVLINYHWDEDGGEDVKACDWLISATLNDGTGKNNQIRPLLMPDEAACL